jgi:predicted Zn finger-like uncharacterized protein
MIAACPKCEARYRIERERLTTEGVRLRCTRCQGVFRVRLPQAVAPAAAAAGPPEKACAREEPARAPQPEAKVRPAVPRPPTAGAQEPSPAPSSEHKVLVALPDADLGKQTVELLAAHGLQAAMVHDGVEAMLEIQRQLPRAVLLSATLPRMYGFQICEIVKRNESLRSIFVVLAGAVHHRDRYRRPVRELHGADAYLEEPDLPAGLLPLLARAGIEVVASSEVPPAPGPEPSPPPAPQAAAAVPEPPPPAPPADDELSDARRKAERLARIIVSDIVLYNQAKFEEAVRSGSVQQAMAAELDEGRGLFRERVDPRVRGERDHLMEELLRVAQHRAAG